MIIDEKGVNTRKGGSEEIYLSLPEDVNELLKECDVMEISVSGVYKELYHSGGNEAME